MVLSLSREPFSGLAMQPKLQGSAKLRKSKNFVQLLASSVDKNKALFSLLVCNINVSLQMNSWLNPLTLDHRNRQHHILLN